MSCDFLTHVCSDLQYVFLANFNSGGADVARSRYGATGSSQQIIGCGYARCNVYMGITGFKLVWLLSHRIADYHSINIHQFNINSSFDTVLFVGQ